MKSRWIIRQGIESLSSVHTDANAETNNTQTHKEEEADLPAELHTTHVGTWRQGAESAAWPECTARPAREGREGAIIAEKADQRSLSQVTKVSPSRGSQADSQQPSYDVTRMALYPCLAEACNPRLTTRETPDTSQTKGRLPRT